MRHLNPSICPCSLIIHLSCDRQLHSSDRAGKQVLWTSERDGWMHIYLYDLEAGSCSQLTSGEWVVRAIEHWDAEQRVLYFSAAGREQPGVVDPYLRHLYSIPVDQPGAVPTLLTPEPADHAVKFSPDGCRNNAVFATASHH